MAPTARPPRATDSTEQLARDVLAAVRAVPDFPSRGIVFQDLCPVLARPGLLGQITGALLARFAGRFDAVLAVEARGFVFGAALASACAAPLVLARKPGKLPGPVSRAAYALEYGTAELELQRDAFAPGTRLLVVDDVLATGGTLAAAGRLATSASGRIAGYAVIMTIAGLGGADRLAPAEVFSLTSAGG
jgi:adenine phosphoribosyltransferase